MSDADDLTARLRAIPVFDGALPAFDVDAAPADPVDLFGRWIAHAIERGVREPHAMTLATADATGLPNARVLILKSVSADGAWRFAGSRTTAKGAELEGNSAAAATFYWAELGRQIRLRGVVREAGQGASTTDFLARSPGARAETLVGRQGQPLAASTDLEEALAEAVSRVEAEPGLVADRWVLWELVASEVEFFQGDASRRHRRLVFERTPDGWRRSRLWP